MKIDYIARKVDLTDDVKQFTEKRLSRLDKYFNHILGIRAEFTQERHLFEVDFLIHGKDFDARAKGRHKDLRSAIQKTADKLEIQASKGKTKLKGRRRGEETLRAPDWSVEVLARDSISSGTPEIVKTSTIEVKPMTIDEAMLQLEKSRNDFIVFQNANDNRVNVLYRRRDKNLGLITPEL